MDHATVQSFLDVKKKLMEKKSILMRKKEKLKIKLADISSDLEKEELVNMDLRKKFKKKHEIYQGLSNIAKTSEIVRLKDRIDELNKELRQIEGEIPKQKTKNEHFLNALYQTNSGLNSHPSLEFVRRALMSELSELVEAKESSDKILAKEKQLQLCNSIF